MISPREKKRRKNEKELKSLRNKMGKNLVWFDSLTLSKQYNLLFEWKQEKFANKVKVTKTSSIKRFHEIIEVISYPASLKHFIKSRKQSSRYRSSVDRAREAIMNILFKK